MKCRYTFSVQSNVKLDHALQFWVGDRRFELVNEEGRLSKLVVEVTGLSTSDAGSTAFPDVANKRSHIVMGAPLFDEIRA